MGRAVPRPPGTIGSQVELFKLRISGTRQNKTFNFFADRRG